MKVGDGGVAVVLDIDSRNRKKGAAKEEDDSRAREEEFNSPTG